MPDKPIQEQFGSAIIDAVRGFARADIPDVPALERPTPEVGKSSRASTCSNICAQWQWIAPLARNETRSRTRPGRSRRLKAKRHDGSLRRGFRPSAPPSLSVFILLCKPKSEKSEAACGGFFWVVRPTLRRRADEAASSAAPL